MPLTLSIDKNLSAIFCIWDRIFWHFQEELADELCIWYTKTSSNMEPTAY